MQTIHIHDKTFTPFISEEDIKAAVKRLALQLDNDYSAKKPLIIAILNGSFMFAASLLTYVTVPVEICFIKLVSYHGTSSTGNVITSIGLDAELENRHVLILEDIVDTGKTLTRFLPEVYNQHPASVKIAALLHKPEATMHEIDLDYNCFKIPNKFVVGFGLDYNGLGRNFPAIYQLKEE